MASCGVTARLHHERIARNGASRWLALTHGILGSGANWRGIARKLVQRRPEWGVVLVDLPQHGQSERGEPPHDLAACAADMRALLVELGDVIAIGGHSFGGKVMLATRGLAPPGLRQTWILDAVASAPPHVHVHPIPTGHWLHIEAPDAVLELLATELPTGVG